MSTIIIITVPTKPQLSEGDVSEEETIIKVKLEGDGSVSNLLREAADVLDGHA